MTKGPLEISVFFAKVNSSGIGYDIMRCIPVDYL